MIISYSTPGVRIQDDPGDFWSGVLSFLGSKSSAASCRRLWDQHPLVKHHVSQSFYVDDFLAGADTPEDAIKLQFKLRNMLLRGDFDLRKWRSSSQVVIDQIQPDLLEKVPI